RFPDLRNVLLPALADLLAEFLAKGSLGQSALPPLGIIHRDVGNERTREPSRLAVWVGAPEERGRSGRRWRGARARRIDPGFRGRGSRRRAWGDFRER